MLYVLLFTVDWVESDFTWLTRLGFAGEGGHIIDNDLEFSGKFVFKRVGFDRPERQVSKEGSYRRVWLTQTQALQEFA